MAPRALRPVAEPWQWQRWGVYGLVFFAAVAIVFQALGGNIMALLFGGGGLLLLVLLIRPIWDQHGVKEMQKRNVQYGVATLCVGGGQGAAVVLERA